MLSALFKNGIPGFYRRHSSGQPLKKKGHRKVPLAQHIKENCLDAFVSGVNLGKSPEVDAPQMNIQYVVLEIDEEHHELVEKLYFDRLEDFVSKDIVKGECKIEFLPF